jgi:hypothetical protein
MATQVFIPLQLGADVWITRNTAGDIHFQVISFGDAYERPRNNGECFIFPAFPSMASFPFSFIQPVFSLFLWASFHQSISSKYSRPGAETPEIQLLVAEGGIRLTAITSGSRDPQADVYGVSVHPEHRVEYVPFPLLTVGKLPIHHFPLLSCPAHSPLCIAFILCLSTSFAVSAASARHLPHGTQWRSMLLPAIVDVELPIYEIPGGPVGRPVGTHRS